jgi:hypothetical protein
MHRARYWWRRSALEARKAAAVDSPVLSGDARQVQDCLPSTLLNPRIERLAGARCR